MKLSTTTNLITGIVILSLNAFAPLSAQERGPGLELPSVGFPITPPYYAVEYPAPVKAKEGQLQIGVTYTLWIPEGLKKVRGSSSTRLWFGGLQGRRDGGA
ncbi:MAG: hypothetical protein GXP30_06285 [Verrucomicrobia bacterium]|nr:hypothetical protein [Verrucomicrobiota bacterium]